MIRKILICVGITFGVLVLCLVFFVLLVLSTNNPKGSHQEILPSKEQPFRKALIVYQPSLSDAASRIAHQIAKGLNDGGYEVTLNYPGKHLSLDISSYQIVVFGSAVYCSQPSKALIDYIAHTRTSGIKDYTSKKIILYSTGGVPSDTSELDVMRKTLNEVKPYQTIKFNTKKGKEINKIAYDLGRELSNLKRRDD